MAIALVGSLGTVATGTTTASPTFGQSTTAGNLLVLWVTSAQKVTVSGTGWTLANEVGPGVNCYAAVYYRENCGAGEAAPSVTNGLTATQARLGEFSGAATSAVVDQVGSRNSIASPDTTLGTSADATSGELVLTAACYAYSMSGSKTTTHSLNNGTLTGAASNDGTNTANHYRYGAYAITTSNASGDVNTETFTTTNISDSLSVIVSFKVASTDLITVITPQSHIPFIPKGRSM